MRNFNLGYIFLRKYNSNNLFDCENKYCVLVSIIIGVNMLIRFTHNENYMNEI